MDNEEQVVEIEKGSGGCTCASLESRARAPLNAAMGEEWGGGGRGGLQQRHERTELLSSMLNQTGIGTRPAS